MSCDCVLIGRLCTDCKKVETKSGKTMYAFPVASDRGFGDNKQTDFFDVIAFAPTLDKVSEYLKKGKPVKLVGHFTTRKEDVNGKKITFYNFVADSCEFINLGGKPKTDNKHESEENNEPIPPEDFPDIPF